MKKIIFALLLVNALWPSLSFGQYDSLQASVYYLTLNKTTYCRVTLADSGLASVELIDHAGDVVSSYPVLFGRYETTGSDIVMRDSIQQFTMTATYTPGRNLRFEKAFGFMRPNIFQDKDEGITIRDDISYFMRVFRTPEYFYDVRDQYQKHYADKLPFKPGKFQEIVGGRVCVSSDCYTLRFVGDCYQLHYLETIVSRGIWERQHNLIRLHDEDVDHDFWVGIAPEKQLISMLLPTNFGVDTTIWKTPHLTTFRRTGR